MSHRPPTYIGCANSPKYWQCRNHFRNDETASYNLQHATTSGSIIIDASNTYNFAISQSISASVTQSHYITTSLAQCRKLGWFGVLGCKSWHGTWGYDHDDQNCSTYAFHCGMQTDSFGMTYYTCSNFVCSYIPAKNADTKKYMTISVNAFLKHGSIYNYTGSSLTSSQADAYSAFTINETRVATVHKNTGLIALSINQTNSSGSQITASYLATASFLAGKWTDLHNWMSEIINLECPWLYEPGKPQPECPEDSLYLDADCAATCSFHTSSIINNYNWIGSKWEPSVCSNVGTIFGYGTMTWNSESINSRKYFGTSAASGSQGYDLISVLVTLSNPYTSTALNSDVDALLKNWNFDNIRQWRTDTEFATLPTVQYNEVEGAVDPKDHIMENVGWTDPNSSSYDGILMGKPFPMYVSSSSTGSLSASLYPTFWNPKHRNWSWNVSSFTFDGSGSWCNCGEYATECTPDLLLDLSPYPNAILNSPTAFRAYNIPWFTGRMIARKYAEILTPTRPSINWNRPITGSPYYDEETHKDQDCSAGTITDIRYEETQSHWHVTSSLFNITAANPNGNPYWSLLNTGSNNDYWYDEGRKYDYVKVHWTYDYRDYAEVDRVNAWINDPPNATCVNEFNLTTSAVIRPYSRQLKTIDASDQYLRYDPCRLNLLVIEPLSNSSSFTRHTASVFNLPSLTVDDIYSSRLVIRPVQWMTDPFWKEYMEPCGKQFDEPGCIEFTWEEDVGKKYYRDGLPLTTGKMGQVNWTEITNPITEACIYHRVFPMRAWVEAKINPPIHPCTTSLSMSIKEGMRKMGCSTYVNDWNTYTSASGYLYPYTFCEYCDEPYQCVTPSSQTTICDPPERSYPWIIQVKQEDVVLSGSRFSDIYEKNGGGEAILVFDP